MPTTIVPKITNAGLAAAIAAENDGLTLKLTHIALGTGKYTPAYTQTALTGYKEKSAINTSGSRGPGAFQVAATFPEWVSAQYAVGEIGIYAGDPQAGGTLFAVFSSADTLVTRTQINYVLSMALTLARVPEGSVTVEVDNQGGIATAIMAAHVAQANPHPQYQLAANIYDVIMPTGHILHRYDTVNPGTLYPGTTWVSLGAGRVLVGIDSGDADLNAIGKTFGEKYHTLTVNEIPPLPFRDRYYMEHSGSLGSAPNKETAVGVPAYGAQGTDTDNNTFLYKDSFTSGGGLPHMNMQPSLVVAIWRRTA